MTDSFNLIKQCHLHQFFPFSISLNGLSCSWKLHSFITLQRAKLYPNFFGCSENCHLLFHLIVEYKTFIWINFFCFPKKFLMPFNMCVTRIEKNKFKTEIFLFIWFSHTDVNGLFDVWQKKICSGSKYYTRS